MDHHGYPRQSPQVAAEVAHDAHSRYHVHRRRHLGRPLDVHVEGHVVVADVVEPRAREQRRRGARLDPFQYHLLDVWVFNVGDGIRH